MLTLAAATLLLLVYSFWWISSRPKFYEGIFHNNVDVYVEELIFDVEFCLRVVADSSEIEAFLSKEFEKNQLVRTKVDSFGFVCSADFWPSHFVNKTIAYEAYVDKRNYLYGSRGALVENGFLYYWSAQN